MPNQYRITIASPPDRDFLVSEIFIARKGFVANGDGHVKPRVKAASAGTLG